MDPCLPDTRTGRVQNEGLHHITRPRRQGKFTGIVFHVFLQAKATHLKNMKAWFPMARRWEMKGDEQNVVYPYSGIYSVLKRKDSPGWLAQSVSLVHSNKPRLWVWSLVRAHNKQQVINAYVSGTKWCLSFSPSSLFFSKIHNQKNIFLITKKEGHFDTLLHGWTLRTLG